jgi:glyoxylase-like metal-dependent hydrolase (beta-lactamase superfamily II)
MVMARGGLIMIRIALFAFAAATLALINGASAQQTDFSTVTIKTTDLGHHTYMLEGNGGNITVAVAGDGVIMVDSEFAPLHDKIKAAIAAVTNEPVRYLVNTHFHGDHTGGDEAFAKEGTVVVTQVNVKKRLADGSVNGLTGAKTEPVSGAALPSKTYTSALTLKLKGRTAQLHHIANAHTDGDTYVWFADANVLSTGDVVTLGRYPNIDFANGGNIKGMIAGVDTYLKLVNDQTKIVPGHGPLANKAMLVSYRAMLVTARDRMAKLVKAGKSEQDVIAAKPFADFDEKLGASDQQRTNFIRVVYHSLKP